MLSNKETICPDNLLNVAHKKKGVPAAIVNAGMPLPMLSTMDAVNENLITPILIGDKNEIENCANNLKFDISKYEVIHEPVENNTAKIAAKIASEKKVKITQIKSAIGYRQRTKDTLKALGINKMNATVVKFDNKAKQGMIKTVNHLVKVEEV